MPAQTAKKLTDLRVQKAKPQATRYEISDGGGPLRLIVQPSGARSFAVRFRFNGETRKLTLPPGVALKAARKLAADAVLQASQGIDACAVKQAAKVETVTLAKDTLRSICAQYFADSKSKALRTAYERERTITRLVYSTKLANRPIAGITRRELTELFDSVEQASGQRTADLVLAILRRVWRWQQLRDDRFSAFPFIPGMNRYSTRENARERTLDDDELARVWAAAGRAGVYGALLRFLLLTSARLREAANMTWDEVGNDGIWELPKSRNKVKTQRLARPLSQAALDLLATLPRIEGCPYPFSVDGKHAFSGFSRHKRRFDTICGVRGWVVHDLRRTSRSLMSRAGVEASVAERILGHLVGTAVSRIYDRHAFVREKRDALEQLATQIEHIIHPQENVVQLLRR
jgi:integrase